MQVVILAAGESSRFWPFNFVHKSLFKLMGKPIIWYTIKGLVDAGTKDIIIIQGANKDIEQELKNYPEYNQNIKYVSQNKPKGMGDALNQARDLLTEQFLLVLADRVDCGEITNQLSKIITSKTSSAIIGSATDTPSLFGILKIENNKVVEIVEKPQKGEEPSDIKALGIYVLTPDFFDIYEKVSRHQYNFEEALSLYMKKNEVNLILWEKEAPSLKYPWHLFGMRNYLFNKYLKKSIGKNTNIAKNVDIIGDVVIGDNVSIMENVAIKGPCYIGNDVFIGNNAILRGGVDVENNCTIGANMEIKNSLILQNSTTHSGFIGDSVVGQNCRIAAQFCAGNVRLDRGIISTEVKGKKIETGNKYLGTFIGGNSDIGIKVSTMPGIIVGRNVTIGPSTVVMKNIPDDTKYYTKFQEIVNKKKVQRLAQDLRKPIILFDIDYTLFDTAFFKESKLLSHKVYGETIDVLGTLGKIATLGIFSKGETEFQKTKLQKTGINKFFQKNHTHVFEDKDINIEKVMNKYRGKKLFLIDDKLPVLQMSKAYNPAVFTIWVKRGPFAENQKEIPGFTPDAEVENLSEVVRIVRNTMSS